MSRRSKRHAPPRQRFRLVISWMLAAGMLGYGVVETLMTAAKLLNN